MMMSVTQHVRNGSCAASSIGVESGPKPATFQRMKSVSMTLALLCFSGCANQAISVEQARAEKRLPTSDEVTAYIGSRWDTEYGPRFARFASHPSQQPVLVSVTNVSCSYYIATPECSFEIAAHFPDEPLQQRNMQDQYGWTDDGKLQSVIVMYHERKR